jgi:hypothetical protein
MTRLSGRWDVGLTGGRADQDRQCALPMPMPLGAWQSVMVLRVSVPATLSLRSPTQRSLPANGASHERQSSHPPNN